MRSTRNLGLDGLRGLAAAVVLLHHVGVVGDRWIAPQGYLAVDLFFLLSGFVIAHAYENRLREGLSVGRYMFAVRLVRLYPLIFLGSALGLVNALTGVVWSTNPSLAWLAQITFAPRPGPPIGALFPHNGVEWSLLFELGVNALHALFLRHLTIRTLAVIVLISGASLVLTAFSFGNLSVGWGADNWWGGLPRVMFSFPLGVLLFRLHAQGRLRWLKAPWPVLAVALAAAALWPSPRAAALTAAKDLAAVLLVFPPLVLAAANIRLKERTGALAAFAGEVSYPLYAIHMPLLIAWKARFGFATAGFAVEWVSASIVIFVVAFAAARLYDDPLRRLLNRWLDSRFQALPSGAGLKTTLPRALMR